MWIIFSALRIKTTLTFHHSEGIYPDERLPVKICSRHGMITSRDFRISDRSIQSGPADLTGLNDCISHEILLSSTVDPYPYSNRRECDHGNIT